MKRKMQVVLVALALVAGGLSSTGCKSIQKSHLLESTGVAGEEVAEQGGEIATAVFDALKAIFGIVKGLGKDVDSVIDAAIPDAAPDAPPAE